MEYLSHHGITGMHWGIRRYQNKDGSLTPAGKEHYATNYRPDQISYDKRVYGIRGSERVNKKLKAGYKISEARQEEADRIYKTRRIGMYVGKSTAIAGAGAVAGGKLGRKAGHGATMAVRGYSPKKWRYS